MYAESPVICLTRTIKNSAIRYIGLWAFYFIVWPAIRACLVSLNLIVAVHSIKCQTVPRIEVKAVHTVLSCTLLNIALYIAPGQIVRWIASTALIKQTGLSIFCNAVIYICHIYSICGGAHASSIKVAKCSKICKASHSVLRITIRCIQQRVSLRVLVDNCFVVGQIEPLFNIETILAIFCNAHIAWFNNAIAPSIVICEIAKPALIHKASLLVVRNALGHISQTDIVGSCTHIPISHIALWSIVRQTFFTIIWIAVSSILLSGRSVVFDNVHSIYCSVPPLHHIVTANTVWSLAA